jgi:uncharacterized repeat protein (TIGR03803 family)
MRISAQVKTPPRVLAFAALLCVTASAWASKTVLYSFPGGANGQSPTGTLARDASGNLYGTAVSGGISNNRGGCGVVFELSPATGGSYTPSVLYTFQSANPSDGCNPQSGSVLDSAGNLYGTTTLGGSDGCGTVYQLVSGSGGTWTEKILWNFTCGSDGAFPYANVVFDSMGNLYGTTSAGGNAICTLNGGESGCGTVYKLALTTSGEWRETTLYQFTTRNGIDPGPLSIDAHGNLFGTTYFGGPSETAANCENGCGVAFELTRDPGASFAFNLIYTFGVTSETDGIQPNGVVIANGSHLFGPTMTGGTEGGTVWELTRGVSGWTETILYNFQGGSDAIDPVSPLLLGPKGALYGLAGGGTSAHCTGGCGTLFRVANSESGWLEHVLAQFNKSNGDMNGSSGNQLIQDSAGNIYGVTASGGSAGYGVVFEYTP